LDERNGGDAGSFCNFGMLRPPLYGATRLWTALLTATRLRPVAGSVILKSQSVISSRSAMPAGSESARFRIWCTRTLLTAAKVESPLPARTDLQMLALDLQACRRKSESPGVCSGGYPVQRGNLLTGDVRVLPVRPDHLLVLQNLQRAVDRLRVSRGGSRRRCTRALPRGRVS